MYKTICSHQILEMSLKNKVFHEHQALVRDRYHASTTVACSLKSCLLHGLNQRKSTWRTNIGYSLLLVAAMINFLHFRTHLTDKESPRHITSIMIVIATKINWYSILKFNRLMRCFTTMWQRRCASDAAIVSKLIQMRQDRAFLKSRSLQSPFLSFQALQISTKSLNAWSEIAQAFLIVAISLGLFEFVFVFL